MMAPKSKATMPEVIGKAYERDDTGAAPVGGFLWMWSQISFHSMEESAFPAE